MVDDNINLSVCAPEVGMLQLELLSLARSLSSVTKYRKPYKQKRKMYSGMSTEKKGYLMQALYCHVCTGVIFQDAG